MAEMIREGGAAKPRTKVTPTNQEDLSELRSLLFSEEQAQINKLQRRLDDPKLHAEDVSRVLPDAIALRTSRDKRFTKALMPTIEEGITGSVRKNPETLANAIFPVIGPAIRKTIAQIFSQMVQSLNQTLEHSLSIKGLKWRIEGIRTGRPFAEVVLSHTLLYSVEQVFLIHKKHGAVASTRGATVRNDSRRRPRVGHAHGDSGFRSRFIGRAKRRRASIVAGRRTHGLDRAGRAGCDRGGHSRQCARRASRDFAGRARPDSPEAMGRARFF